jgi:hypothetical protein
MTSIHVDLDRIEWTPGSAYKGPNALYQGQEVFYRKELSDQRGRWSGGAVEDLSATRKKWSKPSPWRGPRNISSTCAAAG